MDMEQMMEQMGGSESGEAMGKSEKVARIKSLVSEAKALADDCGYDMGEALKDLQMDAAQPDDSDDMEEAGEAYEQDDSPEMGDSSDKAKNKALAIEVLKKKKMGME
jgi:hypothetical protein